jgi:uncharacterized lipoprotein YddW (UPF0748 family)
MFNPWGSQFDGKHYLDYLVQQADARGIRVHAWLCIGLWPWMWGMMQSGTPSWKWSQANWLDMSRPEVQAAVGEAAADLAARVPGLAGVHLDYIRIPDGMSQPSIAGDDVTACVAAARAATAANGLELELTAAVVPHTFPGFDMAECRQPWNQWLDDGLLDVAMPMLYYSASIVEGQINHVESDSAAVQAGTVIGVAPASHQEIFRSVADWEAILGACVRREYDMAVFDNRWLGDEYQPGLEQWPVSPDPPDRPIPKPPPIPAIGKARRWMWAQGAERLSVDGTRDMLAICKACHVSDILFLTHAGGGRGALWNSKMFNSSASRYDGVPYLDYLVEQAAAQGMRVHGWLVVGTWPWIWGMLRDSTSDAWRWDQANWPDLSRADVQAMIGEAVADLCSVPGLSGVHLDYLRLPDGMRDQGITEQHVTACVAAAREATNEAELELTAAVVPHTWPGKDMTEYAQRWTGWLDDGLIDHAIPILYHDASTVGEQIDHIGGESETVRDRVVIGVAPADPDGVFRSVADWEAILDVCDECYHYVSVYDDTWLGSEYQPAVQQRPPEDKPDDSDDSDGLGLPGHIVEELLDIAERLTKEGQDLGEQVTTLSGVAAALSEAADKIKGMGSNELPGLLPATGDTDGDDD